MKRFGEIKRHEDVSVGGTNSIAWGGITGTLSSQTDLQNALNAKAAATDLTALTSTVAGKANSSHAHTIADVTGLQTAIDGKQPLATVLTNTTAAFTIAQETKLAGIATGATANSADATLLARANHTGTQAISTVTGLQTALDAKQATLVSGTNIKTINGTSLLGTGDIVISGGGGGASLADSLKINSWGI